ncbi:hypothetical protein FRB91_011504 [Serendipita sp. 411]|nr:hypothetical protein FRB91_011504 [Serendipita sp. 411]
MAVEPTEKEVDSKALPISIITMRGIIMNTSNEYVEETGQVKFLSRTISHSLFFSVVMVTTDRKPLSLHIQQPYFLAGFFHLPRLRRVALRLRSELEPRFPSLFSIGHSQGLCEVGQKAE